MGPAPSRFHLIRRAGESQEVERLEYCGQKEPYFSIVLENTGDGCWITAKNEHGETMNSEIVEDKELPYLNTPLAEAITLMVHAIRNTAHACY